jgi:hypothetical protein
MIALRSQQCLVFVCRYSTRNVGFERSDQVQEGVIVLQNARPPLPVASWRHQNRYIFTVDLEHDGNPAGLDFLSELDQRWFL